MKRVMNSKKSVSRLTAIVLALVMSTPLIAQTEGEEVEETQVEEIDTMRLSIDNVKILIISNLSEKSNLSDTNDTADTEHDKEPPRNKHWAGFEIGVNGYLTADNKATLPASFGDYELDYAKSLNWRLNFFEKDIRIVDEYVKIVTGMGIEWSNYGLKSKYSTLIPGDSLTVAVDSSFSLKKNKLKTTHLNVPLMIAFNTSKDKKKAFHLATGVVVGWRIGSRLKQKYTISGEDYKPKVISDFNMNPFRYSAIARVGYGKFNLYATYALNTLFEENKGPEVYPFAMGVQVVGF